jgi:cysteine desulfurase
MAMVYLDNAATTPMDPQIIDLLQSSMREQFANSGAVYGLGLDAKNKIEAAAETIASALGIPSSHNIIFTSGGTESNNLFIKGLCAPDKKTAYSGLEHPSITETLKSFKQSGNEPLSLLEFIKDGKLDLSCTPLLKEKRIRLLCLSHVNNELGTINDPLPLIASLEKEAPETRLFLDGVQAIGKIKLDKSIWSGLAGYSLSAHKIHGPKGIGLLIYNSRLKLHPQLHGGKQQFGLRAGTLPVPLIMAFAKTIELAISRQQEAEKHLQKLQKCLVDGLHKLKFPTLSNSSSEELQSPAIVNFSFPPVEGEVMLHHLEEYEIFVGMGSACSAHSKEPSKILMGIGLTEEQARCSLRISFSRNNTCEEVEKFIHAFAETYQKLLPTFKKKTENR